MLVRKLCRQLILRFLPIILRTNFRRSIKSFSVLDRLRFQHPNVERDCDSVFRVAGLGHGRDVGSIRQGRVETVKDTEGAIKVLKVQGL